MTRQQASELLRKTLDEQGLKDWHIRLSTDTANPNLGLCSYKDSCIILNAHFIDQIPDVETIRIIYHVVAHALTPGHQHDVVWEAKAKELGCDDTSPCAASSLNDAALDAIRSGAELVVSFTEEKVMKPITTYEEVTVRKPKYEVRKLEDRCNATLKSGSKCNKVLKEMTSSEFISGDKRWKRITFECGHSLLRLADSQTLFENFITFEHRDNNCKHNWNKNECMICGAFRPYQFQIEGMRAVERNNGKQGLFDEMGLGKTIQSLGWINFHPEALPVLYLVKSPPTKYQWLSQITRWLGPKYFAQVLRSSKETFLPGLKSYIVSYDILRRLDQSKFEHLIEKIGVKTLVLDECQHIKNPDSTRTRMVRMLAKKIPNILPLSGTPWKNRGSEFFVVLNMLDPKKFWSYEAFKRDWVEEIWDGQYRKEGGIKNPAKFKEYIKDIAIRRERIEVMPELPLVTRNKIILEVPETLRASYDAAQAKLIKEYNEAVIGGEEDTFSSKSKTMQNLMLMRQIIGMAKIPGTIEYLQDWLEESNTSIICFVEHIECGVQIYKQMYDWCLENKRALPLKIVADMNGEERFQVQEEFNNSSTARLLVASTRASGEALNLQKQCWKVYFHERQWNPANEEQAESRVLRIGQISKHIDATYAHADDTCDITLDSIVERKRRQFHNAMNKGEMPVWNEASVLRELVNDIISSSKKKVA